MSYFGYIISFVFRGSVVILIYYIPLLGRSKKKMEVLERKLSVAKQNYVQFGGQLEEEHMKLKQDRQTKKWDE